MIAPTNSQQTLIDLDSGPHLVLAPPGSGKTFVLTQRIVRLLTQDRAATFRILALTYTTKAAEELRERVKLQAGETAHRVYASTFHAFCLDALQHYGHFVDFAADTTVYESESDRLDVLVRALKETGHPVPERKDLRSFLGKIGRAKRALRGPESIEDPYFSEVYSAYNRNLHSFHGCDFDDLLWFTWKMFIETPKVAKHFRRLYKFIVMDEAQDTSRLQYEILRSLCGEEHRNVMLVADNDQFIYRFAGASDKWLTVFAKDFGATSHRLVENFRSATIIVRAANALLSDGQNVRAMSQTENAPPGSVGAFSYRDEHEEAMAVVDWTQHLLSNGLRQNTLHPTESHDLCPEDICILGRSHASVKASIEEFKRRGIPVLFRTGRDLFETPEARLVLDLMKVVQNPADLVTRDRLYGSDPTPHSTAHIFLKRIADQPADASPFAAQMLSFFPSSPAEKERRLHLSTQLAEFVRAQAQLLEENANTCAQQQPERAAKLYADAHTLCARLDAYIGSRSPESRSIGGFLGEVALAGRSVIEGPGIRVLTIHVAKGLEFRAVVIVGMNEGTLPDYRSLDGNALKDEQRIAYVGVTRASRALLLTRPRQRTMPWGDIRGQTESRFIRKMGLSMSSISESVSA